MGEIRVTKLDAARRQIDQAIRMLFDSEDPVPIQTLAMAGFKIVRDLSKHHDGHILEQTIKASFPPEVQKAFWTAIHHPANFLKHADNDPEDTLSGVQEEANDALLYFATLWYQELGCKPTPEMRAILALSQILHPEFLLDTAPVKQLVKLPCLDTIRAAPREAHLLLGKELIQMARDHPDDT